MVAVWNFVAWEAQRGFGAHYHIGTEGNPNTIYSSEGQCRR